MSPDRLQQDLDYVAAAVRRHDASLGVPAIYFLWAVLVPVGFALPDLAPGIAGPYWLVAGIVPAFLLEACLRAMSATLAS